MKPWRVGETKWPAPRGVPSTEIVCDDTGEGITVWGLTPDKSRAKAELVVHAVNKYMTVNTLAQDAMEQIADLTAKYEMEYHGNAATTTLSSWRDAVAALLRGYFQGGCQ